MTFRRDAQAPAGVSDPGYSCSSSESWPKTWPVLFVLIHQPCQSSLLHCSFLFALGGWRCFAFPCFALPCRHRSPTRPTLDCRYNVWMTIFSAVFFLSFSLLVSFWIESASRFALIGMGFGASLGLLGLAMTRWERRPEGLFYTPSRWLVRSSR